MANKPNQTPETDVEKSDTSKDYTLQIENNTKKIDTISTDLKNMAEAVQKLLGTIDAHGEIIALLKEQLKVGKDTPVSGQLGRPKGNFELNNQFDPAAMYEIARVPNKGSIPDTMQFPDPNDATGQRLLTYSFRMDEGIPLMNGAERAVDENGEPMWKREPAAHYYMPRMFAAAQLRNDGGAKFVLVSPKEVTIEVRGPKLNKEKRIIKADSDYQPPLY